MWILFGSMQLMMTSGSLRNGLLLYVGLNCVGPIGFWAKPVFSDAKLSSWMKANYSAANLTSRLESKVFG